MIVAFGGMEGLVGCRKRVVLDPVSQGGFMMTGDQKSASPPEFPAGRLLTTRGRKKGDDSRTIAAIHGRIRNENP